MPGITANARTGKVPKSRTAGGAAVNRAPRAGRSPKFRQPLDRRPGALRIDVSLVRLRFRDVLDVAAGRPRLAAWLEAFTARPSMRATPLEGETQD